MRIEAILFDADGVVQRPTADRQAQWRALVGGADELVKKFKLDVFTAERPCHLATNQEPYRARHMRDVLDYGKVFDRLFFSCEIGCSKPDPGYFRAILDSLKLPPRAVLFIDDVDANVAAAESVGIRAELFAPSSPAGAVAEMHRVLSNHGIDDCWELG